ncbi:MAG: bifunctional oligoribonuclease/PAP phosphatase NrnA [Clostridia bacterium]|nr:bifunctional oligoribonuclease/PAP phosphatase NrnA [Clostridia bacterium]
MTLDDILNEIQIAEKIVILTHEAPDGDAIGSSLAMKLALKQLGKTSDVIIPEFSRLFSFLPGAQEIMQESSIKEYDLAIALDCGDLKRLKSGEEYFETAKRKIQIDHHGSNTMFGDLNFVNPASPACCEILVEMFEYYGINIDKEMGTCLVAGIITDTGGFRYNKTTAETFEFTAQLLRKGVNVSDIYKRVQDTKTRANFELTKLVIDRMEILEDGKVTFTYITQEDSKKNGAEVGDHEGLVEIGRDIEGVEVSIFIREKEDGTYKASLRSSTYVNVADICLMFGGGGHQMAAGCTFKESKEVVKEKLLNEIKKVLK